MKLLYVTSQSGRRINGFMRSAIMAARELNIDFTIVSNMDQADKELYSSDCEMYGIKAEHIDCDRNPLAKKNYTLAKKQLLELMNREKYDVVHCNTPIGGVLGRICAKEAGIPYVIYQAHGFHFWTGAPLKNWICYYPVERILAHYTDILITINNEDYMRAQKFHLKKGGRVVKVPGVGVDVAKFADVTENYGGMRATEKIEKNKVLVREKIRKEWNIPFDAVVFVSVGELNFNKNHATAIKAFSNANIPNSFYLICGVGPLEEELKRLSEKMGVEKRVKLLGFQANMPEILNASDCFVFSSFREGLPGALMEAMASGLPCIASNIRGCKDLIQDNEFLFDPNDDRKLSDLMKKILDAQKRSEQLKENKKIIYRYDIKEAVNAYKVQYASIQKINSSSSLAI